MSLLPRTVPPKRLAQSITSASTELIISDILDWDGVTDLVPSNFGTQLFVGLMNDTKTRFEIVELDPADIGGASITMLQRGLNFNGSLTDDSVSRAQDWSANETIVQLGADIPQLYQFLKEYIDTASIAGAVPATATVPGIVKIATQTQIDADTAILSGYSIPITPDQLVLSKYGLRLPSATEKTLLTALLAGTGSVIYGADSVGTDAYAITISPAPAAYAAGMIFNFKAGTANTGAATLKINSLAAITIKKNLNSDLITGDILQNQIVAVIHDGTNFQMLSPVARQLSAVKIGRTTHDVATTGTQTIAHGLGAIPKLVKITAIVQMTNAFDSESIGTYDGTTVATVYRMVDSAGTADVYGDDGTSIIYLCTRSATERAEVSIAIDATNITLTWAKVNSPTGVASILWEAFA